MSPVLKGVPPLPRTHPYFKGNACLLVLPGNSCKQFFIALSSISHELVEVYGVIPANSSCMKHWEPTDAMKQVWDWGLLAQLKQCFILMSTGLQQSGILTHLEYHSPPPVNFMFSQFHATSMGKLVPRTVCNTQVQILFSQIKSKIHHKQP